MPSGRCLCGSHRFELEGELQMNHHCHCGYCRKQHGSIFAASKTPWHEIADGLPAFDAYPPGGVQGSCLCGDLRYVIDGPAITARHCHCSRCRKGRGAAYASNLVLEAPALRFTGGADRIRRFEVPDARYFTQSCCGRCAGKVPTVDSERGIAVVPLGGLDAPPPITPVEHSWIADKPGWVSLHDGLPQREGPPAA